MRALVLLGPPGAGKSTCGALAARTLHLPFVDLDARIAQLGGASAGALFARDVVAFRALELRALAAALRERAVVAPGAGVIEGRRARTLLSHARCVLLDVPLTIAFARITRAALDRSALDPVRPWLGSSDAFAAREGPRLLVRAALAHARVDAGAPMSDVVRDLVRTLRQIRASS